MNKLIIAFIFLIFFVNFIGAGDNTITEQLVSRTATTDTYKTPQGNLKTIYYITPHNYFNGTSFNKINLSIKNSIVSPYEFQTEEKGNYKIYFRNNSNTAGGVRFEKDGYFMSYDISGSNMQWREQPGFPSRTDTLGSGASSNSQDAIALINNNNIIYPRAFYNTNVTYSIYNSELKEEFVLYGLPSIKPYTYLEYTGNIKFNRSLQICTETQCFIPSGTADDFNTSGKIYFKTMSNNTIFYLKEPLIRDSNGLTTTGNYRVQGSDAQMNFYLRIPTSFLQIAQFPIYIDPTVTYNLFNATYQSYSNATEGVNCASVIFNEGENPICTSGTLTDLTSDAALDASDDNSEQTPSNSNTDGFIRSRINFTGLDLSRNDILSLNWSWEGSLSATTSLIHVNFALLNQTSNNWTDCVPNQNFSGSTSDTLRSCYTTNVNNFINASNNYSSFLVKFDPANVVGEFMATDFISLTVIYTVRPTLNITYPLNSTNFSSNNVTINYTITNSNYLSSCWYSNSSGKYNTSLTCGTNFSANWSEGINNLTIYANNTDNLLSSSFVSFRVDTTAPTVNIIHPASSAEFSYNTSLNLNTTITDSGVGVQSCWWHLDSGSNNTITCGNNVTFNVSDGTHTVYFYSNDSLNNIGRDVNTFTISLDAPSVLLSFPLNNTYYKYKTNFDLNYTVTDSNGISTVRVYHDLNGSFALNTTRTDVSSGVAANNKYNISNDGVYKWNVWANDTTDSGRSSASNLTFTIDTTYPLISITNIASNTGSQTIRFNFTTNDTNIGNCKYNVLNSSNGYDISNTSLSECGVNNTQAVISDYGTYTLYVYHNDLAGNENYSSLSFTLTSSGVIIQQTGGAAVEEIILIIGQNVSWQMTTENLNNKYDLIMQGGNERNKRVLFTNKLAEAVNLTLTCENVQNSPCQYVTFDKYSLVLNASTNYKDEMLFTVKLPKNITNGVYDFNVVATDQEGNKGKVSVRVQVGLYGIFGIIINKFIGTTQFDLSFLNSNLSDFVVPNILLILLPFIIISPLILLIFSKNKLKFQFSILIPFIFAFLIILFI